MTDNPILDELHAIREKLLADAGGTLDDLVDRIRAGELKSTRPRFEPRKPAEGEKGLKSNELATRKQ